MPRKAVFGVVFLSAFYFLDIFYKASQKRFWFDELCTWYLCQMPRFRDTWAAVAHGADFNPPLFYVLTRGSQWLFGNGAIATRLPSTVGVWLFCVCLFLFVTRRAGPLPGFIAGTFPFFTLVQYYAYEARAHGISLGWCGLALVCWQRRREDESGLWLVAFGFSLLGALLTHVYAVYLIIPFALVEVVELFGKRRVDWGIVIMMAVVSSGVVALVLVPLIREYRNAAMPTTFFPASHDIFQRFLVNTIGPATPILLMSLFFSTLDGVRGQESEQKSFDPKPPVPVRELVVAVGFVLVPLIGLLGCKVSHGPFIDRYFLSTVAGYAVFLGFACSRWRSSGTVKAFAGLILLLIVVDFGSVFYLGIKQRIVLFEPSSHSRLTTTPQDPMMLYESLSRDTSGLDILVSPALDYLYLFHYAPPGIASRLYFGAPAGDVWLSSYERWAKTTGSNMKLAEYKPFLATHDRFLLYESGGAATADAKQAIAAAGYRFTTVRTDAVGILYSFSR